MINIPRKAPKEVIEHRVTLGDYERGKLDKLVDAYDRDKYLENIPSIMLGTAGLITAGVLGFVGYALYNWFDSVPPISEVIRTATGSNEIKSAVVNASDSVLAGMTRAEVEALFDKKRQTLEDSRKLAADMATSDFAVRRVMGERLLAAIDAAEAKLSLQESEIIARWQTIQAQK